MQPIDMTIARQAPAQTRPFSTQPGQVGASLATDPTTFAGVLQSTQAATPPATTPSTASSTASAQLLAAYAQLEESAALDSLLGSNSSANSLDPLGTSNSLLGGSSSENSISALDPLAENTLGLSALPSDLTGSSLTSTSPTGNSLAALSAYISAAMGFQSPQSPVTALTNASATPTESIAAANAGAQTPSTPDVTTDTLSATPANIQSMIQSMAPSYGLSPALVTAVVKQESGFSPTAHSSSGAMGLMQLMPETASSLGVTDPYDPAQNLRGGMSYLSQMLKQYNGNVPLALAAYNAGPGAVTTYGGIPPYPETQSYVSSIMNTLAQTES
ncbi:MAG: lytic transglycosylase domain-containing protein [Firmicutes bacterium]|nr:lytic transglycosylase domain-containing protein [Bacillota bacterium]